MNNKIPQVMEEIQKVILGKQEIVEKSITAILAGGHILLEDVPGVGKTTLALCFQRVLGLDYERIQLTSDSVPSDIMGFTFYDQQTKKFSYRKGAAMTNLLLADELNRTSSRTQSALLEVMQEKQMSVDGNTYMLPEPFIVIATQNPVGSIGTQFLPQSQLDRFMVQLSMGYPDPKSEIDILRDRHHANPLDSIQQILNKQELLAAQKMARETTMADELYDYVALLSERTRSHEFIQLGLSPRGALALCQMAKSHAFVQQRDYVLPEDIQAVFIDVVRHRILLNAKAKYQQIEVLDILKDILEEVSIKKAKSYEA